MNHDLISNSWTTAGFFGLTTIDLKTSNTESLKRERTVLGANVGGTLVYSRNKLSLGGAVGIDVGFGSDAKNWRYQWVPWLGLVIGLEFF